MMKKQIIFIDGAMGTMIQRYKLTEEDFRGERYKNHSHELKVKGQDGNSNSKNLFVWLSSCAYLPCCPFHVFLQVYFCQFVISATTYASCHLDAFFPASFLSHVSLQPWFVCCRATMISWLSPAPMSLLPSTLSIWRLAQTSLRPTPSMEPTSAR
jgi:hypothetical protein